MIIIGEKLNSSIPSVLEAYNRGDEEFIIKIASAQLDGGAEYLDVNTAACPGAEADRLLWVVRTVMKARPDAKFMIDSPSAQTIEEVLKALNPPDVIINSITLESDSYDGILPLIKAYSARIVALPISDNDGVSRSAEERFGIAEELISRLRENGVPDNDIFLDALVSSLGTDSCSGLETLYIIRMLRAHFPGIHITGGISNVSFGLPRRAVLGSAFLTAAITCGLDSAIIDSSNPDTRLRLHAALLVNGRDDYCMNYIGCFRALEGS